MIEIRTSSVTKSGKSKKPEYQEKETLTRYPVLTKGDFVQRYKQGEFGNASPTWNTFDEYLAANYSGQLHIRNRVAGGPSWYNVPSDRVRHCLRKLCKQKIITE